jgi:antirestriction protein ArdC
MILAPIVRGKTDSEEEQNETPRTVAGFRAAYVFDISQTDGKELPQIGAVEGDPREYGQRLRGFASDRGISVEYSAEIAPARGLSRGGQITLLPGQSASEEFSTLAHELAHELLHRGDRRASTSKPVRETEAEATAFVVCHAVGLHTGSAASDYIQLWNGDVQVLTESLGYIRQAASQILEALTDT